MPSLITATERSNLTGIFNDIFDTFQRAIFIYKEPLKVPNPNARPESFAFGFGENQTEDAYTYIERTGVYPATIRYAMSASDNTFKRLPDTNVWIPEGGCSIKVKKECRDFINDGKTEKIIVDEKTYFLNSEERKQMFLDSEFWVFVLQPRK